MTLSRMSCLPCRPLPTRSGNAAFSNTVMCGQIAYDWNTMPKLRLLGATKVFLCEEYTTRPSTAISPARGRSSPAIERSVVVLPAAGPEQGEQLAPRHFERDVLRGLDHLAALVRVLGVERVDFQHGGTQASFIPKRRATHCAAITSTNSARMSRTPSADSSTYCPFSQSSQMVIDTTSVPGL